MSERISTTGPITDADLAGEVDYSRLVEVHLLSKKVGHGIFAEENLGPECLIHV
jgi:hypothetical protein